MINKTSKQFSRSCQGFSLVEVAIAISIAAVAIISVIGLLPGILKNERDSLDSTAVGTIYEDVHDRLEGVVLEEGVPEGSPFYYDLKGTYLDPDDSELTSERFYLTEVELVKPIPPKDADDSSTPKFAVKVSIYWPLKDDGTITQNQKPRSAITYFTTSLTGPDWQEIDSNYEPKIEY